MPDQDLANLPGTTKLPKGDLPRKPPSEKKVAKKSLGRFGGGK